MREDLRVGSHGSPEQQQLYPQTGPDTIHKVNANTTMDAETIGPVKRDLISDFNKADA